MLHVNDHENVSVYKNELDQSFRVRHEVFVERKGWEELRREDGREIDQFDTEDAIHLVFLDGNGEVLGGSRLLPTTKPHLLSEVFPHLASMKRIPRGPHTYEWTRFYVKDEATEVVKGQSLSQTIMIGLLEYCLDQGITTLSAIAEPFWMPRISLFGWKPEPLGLPVTHNDQSIMAIKLNLTEEALKKTKRGRQRQTVLYRHSGETHRLAS